MAAVARALTRRPRTREERLHALPVPGKERDANARAQPVLAAIHFQGLLERSQNLLGDPRGREVAVDLVEKHRALPAPPACHQVRAAGTLHQAATDSTEHPLHFA